MNAKRFVLFSLASILLVPTAPTAVAFAVAGSAASAEEVIRTGDSPQPEISLPPAPTTTTLTLSSPEISVGTVETLSARVTWSRVSLAPGVITFFDGKILLGTAELDADSSSPTYGTATLRTHFAIGTHALTASFAHVGRFLTSTSTVQTLTVTGLRPTTTTLTESGSRGDYTLTATVVGSGLVAPAGEVSFADLSNGGALLGSAELGAATQGLSFLNPGNPLASGESRSVAVADFNGDGIPDIVTTLHDVGEAVLLGNGDGTFRYISNPVPNIDPYAVVVGDFNADGIPDLAIMDFYPDTVWVVLGNGDGTFQPPSSTLQVATNDALGAIVVGDFNRDGMLDLAIANGGGSDVQSNGWVEVYLGNGDGTFRAVSQTTPIGAFSYSMAVADLNGDGIPDLAVTNEASGTVSVLLGVGNGTFTVQSTFGTPGDGPGGVVAADLNGDGIPDLAVANAVIFNGVNYGLSVYLGKGDGTFNFLGNFPTGLDPNSVALADFNGDGIPDLAFANLLSNTVTLLLGKGDGTFTEPSQSAPTGFSPLSVAVGDFNGDGIPDVVAGNQFAPPLTVVLTEWTETASASISGVSPAGSGKHLVDATYAGDSQYVKSVSNEFDLLAGLIPTGLTLTANPVHGVYGQQVLLTAQLTPYAGQGHTTNGEIVTFSYGSTTLGTGTLSSGIATLNVNSLPVGADSLQASYPGDADFAAVAAHLTVDVSQATQTISFPAIASQVQGGTVTLSATGGASGNPVTFSSSTPTVCTVSGDTASLIAPGTCSITAKQPGNVDYLPASAVTQSFSVTAEFLLEVSPASEKIKAPGTAPLKLKLKPEHDFSGSVVVSCSGLPSGAKCTGLPRTIKLTGAASVRFTAGVRFAAGTKAGEYVIGLTAVAGVHNDSTKVTITVEK